MGHVLPALNIPCSGSRGDASGRIHTRQCLRQSGVPSMLDSLEVKVLYPT